MSILKIARLGHPVLLQAATPVSDPADPQLHRLVRDMVETLDDAGGVGLAAPQVHVSSRVIIYLVPASRMGDADLEEVPLTAVLNPILEPLGEERELGWEGCLSIPGMRGAVPRWRRVRLTGRALDGSEIDLVAEGFHARVLQHEVDHLDGILYPMRMNDLSLFAYNEEWQRYMAEADLRERHTKETGE